MIPVVKFITVLVLVLYCISNGDNTTDWSYIIPMSGTGVMEGRSKRRSKYSLDRAEMGAVAETGKRG